MKRIKFGLIICGILLAGMAKAQAQQYTINATAGTGGYISPIGEIIAKKDTTITFAFAANDGYRVNSLLIDNTSLPDSIANGSYTFNKVATNHTISVLFRIESNDQSHIAKKNGSNILICKDIENVTRYHWGYRQKETSTESAGTDKWIDSVWINKYNSTKDILYTNCQYIDYTRYKDNGDFVDIDTSAFDYFVQITYNKNDNDNIPTRYYYYPSVNLNRSQAHKFFAYPNPTKGNFSVAFGAEVKGKLMISLQNLSGQTLLSKQIANYETGEALPFDSNFPPGIYLLVVQTNEGILTSKIVIE